MVELAGTNVTRLKEVVELFENLPLSSRTSLLRRLTDAATKGLQIEDLRVLSEAIREKVNRHRRFAHTDWAMKEEELTELDSVRGNSSRVTSWPEARGSLTTSGRFRIR